MKMYAKITNEETKACSVGTGTNTAFYESIGMTEQEVEQAWDGAWYIAGYAPEKPEDIKAREEIAELKKALTGTDYAIIKIAEGVATVEEYADIITERAQWRARINELEKTIE